LGVKNKEGIIWEEREVVAGPAMNDVYEYEYE